MVANTASGAQVSDADFIRIWNESSNRWEVVRKTGLALTQVQHAAHRLRKAGKKLKVFTLAKNGRMGL